MALDPTAREANVRDSIIKYFKDNLKTTEGITTVFDIGISQPDSSSTQWVSVNFGAMEFTTMSTFFLYVHCCTREDNEGWRLAQLKDKVLGYLSDENATHGMKSITLYRSYLNQAWVAIGGLLVQEVLESGQLLAPDGTKYKTLSVRLRTASKL